MLLQRSTSSPRLRILFLKPCLLGGGCRFSRCTSLEVRETRRGLLWVDVLSYGGRGNGCHDLRLYRRRQREHAHV